MRGRRSGPAHDWRRLAAAAGLVSEPIKPDGLTTTDDDNRRRRRSLSLQSDDAAPGWSC